MNKFGEELGRLLEFQNISINEYAERIGTTPKNLIDIIDGKVALSFNMISNIAFVSELSIEYIYNVEESFKIKNNIDVLLEKIHETPHEFLKRFNYKELTELYNVKYRDNRNDYHILEDIFKYLRIYDPYMIYKENNHIFYKSKNDKPELLALWLERCYRVLQEQEVSDYNPGNIEKLVKFIRKEAKNNSFSKEKLITMFNKNGIFLAIEPDLKGSKIRGACRVLNGKPAIYLTTKYKRIADIYFALLHELAHCKSDFNRAKNGSIVSMIDEKEDYDYEIKADKKAFNWMVEDKQYQEIIKNKDYKYEIMPFLVYRLANDNIIKYNSKLYQDNNHFISI